MLKVDPASGYPPEKGRYIKGNDYSPVAVCVILDTFDFAIPKELNDLVMAGADSGASISGMLQTENIGIEKIICNIVANPNIRYIILCGRESSGHMPGQSLLALKQNGVDSEMRIIGSKALTPNLPNIPQELINRFNKQINIIDILCKPGEQNLNSPGLQPSIVENAVKSCYQESATEFMGYSVYDVGAYPEPPIIYNIISKLQKTQEQAIEPGKTSIGTGLLIHKLLPKTDCQECGKRNCLAFAIDLSKKKKQISDCPVLQQTEYVNERRALTKILE